MEAEEAPQELDVIDVQADISFRAVRPNSRTSGNSTTTKQCLAALPGNIQRNGQYGIVNVSILQYNSCPTRIRLGSAWLFATGVSPKLMPNLKMPCELTISSAIPRRNARGRDRKTVTFLPRGIRL
jgi:hypothetical protein